MISLSDSVFRNVMTNLSYTQRFRFCRVSSYWKAQIENIPITEEINSSDPNRQPPAEIIPQMHRIGHLFRNLYFEDFQLNYSENDLAIFCLHVTELTSFGLSIVPMDYTEGIVYSRLISNNHKTLKSLRFAFERHAQENLFSWFFQISFPKVTTLELFITPWDEEWVRNHLQMTFPALVDMTILVSDPFGIKCTSMLPLNIGTMHGDDFVDAWYNLLDNEEDRNAIQDIVRGVLTPWIQIPDCVTLTMDFEEFWEHVMESDNQRFY